MVQIILASGSPRRREILRGIGLETTSIPSGVDESLLENEDPFQAAERLAVEKARDVASRCPAGSIVLGADTLVVMEGAPMGKPRDRDDSARMLRALSGKAHDVVTGVALCRDSELVSGRELTRVIFSTLSDDVVRRYVATGEPDDKAGAYALQGIGGMLVERVEGSPSNVVGLPVRLVRRLALELGIDLL